ncbi:hypothetical protein B0H11DRAFT_2202554 [Mycena galericulata]|nr:hypothetical protein B0H11DRAFT_2202554 [Mycena galericulata]
MSEMSFNRRQIIADLLDHESNTTGTFDDRNQEIKPPCAASVMLRISTALDWNPGWLSFRRKRHGGTQGPQIGIRPSLDQGAGPAEPHPPNGTRNHSIVAMWNFAAKGCGTGLTFSGGSRLCIPNLEDKMSGGINDKNGGHLWEFSELLLLKCVIVDRTTLSILFGSRWVVKVEIFEQPARSTKGGAEEHRIGTTTSQIFRAEAEDQGKAEKQGAEFRQLCFEGPGSKHPWHEQRERFQNQPQSAKGCRYGGMAKTERGTQTSTKQVRQLEPGSTLTKGKYFQPPGISDSAILYPGVNLRRRRWRGRRCRGSSEEIKFKWRSASRSEFGRLWEPLIGPILSVATVRETQGVTKKLRPDRPQTATSLKNNYRC